MSGGMVSARIEMCFTATGQFSMMREAGLYEADMSSTAILGFPFLFKEAWLVDARRQCLMERGHNKLLRELQDLQYDGPDCLSPDAMPSYIHSFSVVVSRVHVDDSDWHHELDRRILYPRLLKGYTFSDDAEECADWSLFSGTTGGARAVHQVVEVSDRLQGEEIVHRGRIIHDRYKETSYRGTIWPEQPTRGPFGEARLTLRPGYRVRHCKPMQFGGE